MSDVGKKFFDVTLIALAIYLVVALCNDHALYSTSNLVHHNPTHKVTENEKISDINLTH